MYKHDSLRQHLSAATPDLQRDPDKFLVFADEGQLVACGTGSLSFEYRFTLNVILTDYAGNLDGVMVALLAWIAVHQSELLNNPELRKTGISFEVDYHSHHSVDLSLKLSLTERIIVSNKEQGRLQIKSRPEPQATLDYAAPFWALYEGDNKIAEWATPQTPP
ncbi:phage tail protein [Glaciimonas sp. PCH181]|uniref:phage tail protein n=1 Tax=Glaciimonas sp. PCH181 TaxID=2133943 RepID=UPI000D3413C2|nr:phage tail protein [Glaciimonas sp. PCH181]PUA16819.1 phage tail protein [Glaciimonas sp. PCH181]